MKVRGWFGRMRWNRSLIVGAIVFGALFLYHTYVVPMFPTLDRMAFDVLAAGSVAAAAWWVAFRAWRC